MRGLPCLLVALAAGPVCAEDPVTAEEFDALTLGRSMTWSEFGAVYGVEQYLPGRRVRWAAVGAECTAGHWYADGPAICFKYETDSEPDCWIITRTADGFDALYTAHPPGTPPVTIAETPDPPACPGPGIGA
ncbi:hypothetical protein [Rhodobacter calidifons]|uniref:Uncharacterized protein n=1 Tax=Rhodobacter calidifons TaxID=2715277 RepID=A0ABX0G609_9RHOB|nr:hypothetical protein [Rhodobacter calidifons]NHB76685.1 hypothetical protein [Rhodobacter calidifons]